MRCIFPTMRSMKIKFFTFTVLMLAVYLFLFYLMIEVWFISKHSPAAMSSVVLPYVVVHIDLKGAPPKLKYLESLLPILRDHGANALLMEYEDMFPYRGKLMNISSTNCYKKSELQNFIKKAVEHDLEIIPLVQTFGHLEHVLKLEEFRHLREIPTFPDSLCPSQIESRALVKHMLEQVINFHNAITPLKHIHVGSDEVFHINKCEQCVRKGLSNIDIFTNHVGFLSKTVQDISSTITVLIWDDMLRSVKPVEWKTIDLPNIEPVYWDYRSSLSVSHVNLLNYHRKFHNIWIASAFKGADGKVATIPNMKVRFLNHFSWMNLILDYKFGGEDRNFNFKGIILTGWSRYSHMDPPCELLPVAIPTLILNLILVKKFKAGIVADDRGNTEIADFFVKHINDDFIGSMKCNSKVDIENFNTQNCNFESTQIYDVLIQYKNLVTDIATKFHDDETALSTIEYYAAKNFMNMNGVFDHINWCNDTLNELVKEEMMLSHFMKRYYDKDVIDEYVNYKTYSTKKKITETLQALTMYSSNLVWDTKKESNKTKVLD